MTPGLPRGAADWTTPARRAVTDRCTARGVAGAVASVAPVAAQAGVDALRSGGNAFDAAVAAALAEIVLQPPKCGLAGDLVAVCRTAAGELRALVSIGGAAQGLADVVRRHGELPVTGALSVGVPGAPAGYAALAALGRLGVRRLTEPARELATRGFVWTRVVDVLTRESLALLRRENPTGCVFLPDDVPPVAGQAVRLPGLAKLLEAFGEDGADLFAGAPGQALCAAVAERGGVITPADLTGVDARWSAPASVDIRGHRLHVTPAPTYGPSLLEALASTPPGASAGTLWSAVTNAGERRRTSLGDPAGDGGTSVVAATDGDGNAAVIVHSNSFPQYGSGIVVGEFDMILSNRAGRGFSTQDGHPNFPEPRQRPATTLHAWALEHPADGPATVSLGATHGGENQMPWNAQALHRMLDGLPEAPAVLSPLWRIGPGPTELTVEGDLPEDETETLRTAGASCTEVPPWSMRSGYQIVTVGGPTPTAVSDLRTIGAAAAW